jgi:hypothetical protein
VAVHLSVASERRSVHFDKLEVLSCCLIHLEMSVRCVAVRCVSMSELCCQSDVLQFTVSV